MEQLYPVLFEEYSLHEGSGGAGEHRGGFGVNYRIRLRRGEARVSMVMDHGRAGPPGAQGGSAGGTNTVAIIRDGRDLRAAASLEGPGHRDRGRRRDRRLDAGRRRLRPELGAAARRDRARPRARLLQRRRGAPGVRRRRRRHEPPAFASGGGENASTRAEPVHRCLPDRPGQRLVRRVPAHDRRDRRLGRASTTPREARRSGSGCRPAPGARPTRATRPED